VGAGYIAFGAVAGTAGGWLLTRDGGPKLYPYLLLGEGALFAAEGTIGLFRTTSEEDVYEAYSNAIVSSDPAQRERAVAAAERSLFALRRGAQRRRIVLRVGAFTLMGLSAAILAINEIEAAQRRHDEQCPPNVHCSFYPTPSMQSDQEWGQRLVWGSVLALSTTLAVSTFVPYSVERLADLWESDPGRVHNRDYRPRLSFAPTPGGAQLQFGGTF
jgi:hypothetical protein